VKNTVVPELQQSIQVFGAFQGDIAAPATVAPTGPATRNELFTAEGNTSISALAAGNPDLGFVNEHVESRSAGRMAKPTAGAAVPELVGRFVGKWGLVSFRKTPRKV
jgi:hypothetical protein